MFRTSATRASRLRSTLGLALLALLLAACGGQMGWQPRCDPLDETAFFENGQCSRQVVPNTIARGQLQDDPLLFEGRGSDAVEEVADDSETRAGGEDEASDQEQAENTQEQPDAATTEQAGPPDYATEFPFPVTMEVLERGQSRYNIYCTPCHSYDGSGDGMIVRRGFPPSSSFHIDRLRDAEPGYIYDVITNGIGSMPDYDGQIREAADRWAIVAYIRALQLSQNATIEDVPEDALGDLQSGGTEEGTEEEGTEEDE